MQYPVRLVRDDNNTILVNFPDFPEAHTYGDDREEALAHAVDALTTIVETYIRDRRDIPAPSRGRTMVAVPALTAAKIELWMAMRAHHISKATLRARLNCHMPQVDRLLNVRHHSRLDQLEAAFATLGKRLVVTVEPVWRALKTGTGG